MSYKVVVEVSELSEAEAEALQAALDMFASTWLQAVGHSEDQCVVGVVSDEVDREEAAALGIDVDVVLAA